MIPASDHGSNSPALVFLHYFGGSRHEWTEVIDGLAVEYRCLAADLPGFGGAAALTGFSVEEMVDSVAGLIQSRELSRFILVGHSMSGKVAMVLASRSLAGLEGLILVASSPPSPEPMSEQDRQNTLLNHGDRSSAEQLMGKITAKPLPAPLFEQAVGDNLRSSAAAWAAWLEYGSREDWSARVGILAIPALVVTGDDDPILPASVQKRFTLPHLSNAKMVGVPGSGHLVPLEAPTTLRLLILDFVREHGLDGKPTGSSDR